jgi:hypothetical protein
MPNTNVHIDGEQEFSRIVSHAARYTDCFFAELFARKIEIIRFKSCGALDQVVQQRSNRWGQKEKAGKLPPLTDAPGDEV